jgi:hypothetical protein
MEHPKATPKDFFLWAGAMLALYGGIIAFIALIFDYINYTMPDTALGYYADPYASISYEMASLIVLAPLFLILMRVIRRSIAHDASRSEVWVRRWALFLTLFVAGATIAIDLIVLLTTFFNGEELSVRFLLKVLVVLLVAAAGFMHFMADLWGYWVKNPHYARYINWAVGALVVLTVLAGFFIVGTPAQARQARLDSQRISDLQSIQWELVNYWQQKQSLPATLNELEDPLSYWQMPLDPSSHKPYRYTRQSPLSFTLCATFATAGNANWGKGESMPVRAYGSIEGDWVHAAGEVCFDRSIDPERYPPYSKPQ